MNLRTSKSNPVTGDETTIRRQLTDTERRLEAALSIGKVGSWLWEIKDDRVIADTNTAKLFGLPARQVRSGLSLAKFIQAIHPEDQRRVVRAIRSAVEEGTTYEEEYRVRTASGKFRWVLARGKLEHQNGTPIFPGVIVDITERRDLQAQIELARRQDQLNRQEAKLLQERNEELEAIARTKDEFVALASHQLRTPATAVKQYVGMVLQGYVGDITPVQAEMLEKAFESNERQIQIINQILNAARADTGRLAVLPVPFDFASLVQGIAYDMQPSIEQRGHTFIVTVPRQPAIISGDIGYLRMAVENVLHNASIYTPEGGTITLKLTRVGKRCRLYVTDTGVGIKKSDLPKLFAKFSRIPNPLSVQAGGTGIGLYLTAEIVRLHGGKIHVTSELHKGTTFAISLPLVENKR